MRSRITTPEVLKVTSKTHTAPLSCRRHNPYKVTQTPADEAVTCLPSRLRHAYNILHQCRRKLTVF